MEKLPDDHDCPFVTETIQDIDDRFPLLFTARTLRNNFVRYSHHCAAFFSMLPRPILVSCYLVRERDSLTLIDALLPKRMMRSDASIGNPVYDAVAKL